MDPGRAPHLADRHRRGGAQVKRGIGPVRHALEQRCRDDEMRSPGFVLRVPDRFYDRFEVDYDVHLFPGLWRWCMALKFAVCYILDREGNAFGNVNEDWAFVAIFNVHSYQTMDGTMHDWSYCAVAPGWRTWRCEVGHDGT